MLTPEVVRCMLWEIPPQSERFGRDNVNFSRLLDVLIAFPWIVDIHTAADSILIVELHWQHQLRAFTRLQLCASHILSCHTVRKTRISSSSVAYWVSVLFVPCTERFWGCLTERVILLLHIRKVPRLSLAWRPDFLIGSFCDFASAIHSGLWPLHAKLLFSFFYYSIIIPTTAHT